MSEYSPIPANMFAHGKKFICPCGNGDFKIELNTEPLRFWCACGEHYTEQFVIAALDTGIEEMMVSGE